MSAHQVAEQSVTKGGEFLIKDTHPSNVFIPEEWNEEQRMIAKMAQDFLEAEVYPNVERLDSMKEPDLMPSILTKAGELGLLGLSVPTEYGGTGSDFLTSMLGSEVLGAGHSFSVALLAHTGIGTLPILYFGTDEQKAKYLPGLASGEIKASYCLTEPGSGSDALGAKTKAILSEDGSHYVINGQKMWITNGGFADVLIVFAKIDGDKFTGFIVDAKTPGISMNEEEKKMGIKGSSTRQIFFSDVKVPAENVLGEIGKGHRIAFNILNIGRIKLNAATTGSSKKVVGQAVKYANERHQFNRPISSFGAIQHKLAEMAILTFVSESALYRATNDIDLTEKKLQAEGLPFSKALLGAAEEYAAECAILKVFGSETLDFVVDEGVQVYGGYGFSAEFPMDRAYRDSRINRIYEGTNEINLMLSVGTLLKKAMKGELDLFSAAMAAQKELMSNSVAEIPAIGDGFAYEHAVVNNLKKAFLIVTGAAAQKYTNSLDSEQEVLMSAARMLMNVYAAESVLLRVEKLSQQHGEEAVALKKDIMRVFLHEAADKLYLYGKEAVLHFAEGEMAKGLLAGLRRYTKTEAYDSVAARRRVAAALIDANDYCFAN